MMEFILGAVAGAAGVYFLGRGRVDHAVGRAREEADQESEREGEARRRHLAKGWKELPDGTMVSPTRAAKLGLSGCRCKGGRR